MFRRCFRLRHAEQYTPDPAVSWVLQYTPEALQPLLHQAQQAPLLCLLGVTGGCLVAIDWHHNRKSHRIIRAAHDTIMKDVDSTLAEVQQTLSRMEVSWSADLKHKEEHIRQLHQQNVQQTRSIDRLTAALRSCQP